MATVAVAATAAGVAEATAGAATEAAGVAEATVAVAEAMAAGVISEAARQEAAVTLVGSAAADFTAAKVGLHMVGSVGAGSKAAIAVAATASRAAQP